MTDDIKKEKLKKKPIPQERQPIVTRDSHKFVITKKTNYKNKDKKNK